MLSLVLYSYCFEIPRPNRFVRAAYTHFTHAAAVVLYIYAVASAGSQGSRRAANAVKVYKQPCITMHQLNICAVMGFYVKPSILLLLFVYNNNIKANTIQYYTNVNYNYFSQQITNMFDILTIHNSVIQRASSKFGSMLWQNLIGFD